MQITLYKKVYHQLITLPENNREPKRAVILFAGKKGIKPLKILTVPQQDRVMPGCPKAKKQTNQREKEQEHPKLEKQPTK